MMRVICQHFNFQFDLQRDATIRATGLVVGGSEVPLFTATAIAAAANNDKENTYRRRSCSLKEGSPLKVPLPKGIGTKRARLPDSVTEEQESVRQREVEHVEALRRSEKRNNATALKGTRRRMSEAESAAIIMGEM
jgi:hypothetical protein